MKHAIAVAALAFSVVAAEAAPQPAAAKRGPPQPSEILAKTASDALGQTFAPDQLDGGLPVALVAIVRVQSKDPESGDRRLEAFRALASKFETLWAAYDARRLEIAPKLDEAAALVKSGDRDGAKLLLRGLISATPEYHPSDLAASDAEWPAILALADLLGHDKDWAGLIALVPSLRARSRVASHADELVSYLFGLSTDDLLRGAAEPGHGDLVHRISNMRELIKIAQIDHMMDGTWGAQAFYDGFAKHGLRGVAIGNLAKAKPGEWIHFPIPTHNLTDSTVAFKFDDQYQEGYACVKTKVIESIDWFNGDIVYHRQCKFRPVDIHIDVNVVLAVPPPDWAKKAGRVVVIGRVKKAGKHVELADAFVADLRTIGKPSSLFGTVTDDE
jgi:hypothetical protein